MSGLRVRLRHRVKLLKTGPFGSALSADEYADDGVPLVNPSDLRGGRIWPEGAVKVPEEVAVRMATYRLCDGDVVLGRRGELGRYGLVGTTQAGYLCGTGSLLVRPGTGLHPKFLGYFLETTEARDWLSLQSVGSTMENLSEAILARLPLPNLPYEVQLQSANFLDEQTARIDALIAEKELLRERVREYEQAEISRLVRTGLSPHTLVSTDREFLPEAPDGWRVTALKRAVTSIEQGWSPQCESRPAGPGEWGVLKVGCVNGTSFDPNENKALPSTLEPDRTCVLKKGDVLMSRANTRELVGMAAFVDTDYSELLLCDKLYRLKLRPDWLSVGYAVLLLRCDYVRRQIELGASGASASMQNISQDVVRELVVGIPPLDEQAEILEAAARVRIACTALANHVTEHIDRLYEYRSSLISAAVTGQLDPTVRT